jgi:hypothetical protein
MASMMTYNNYGNIQEIIRQEIAAINDAQDELEELDAVELDGDEEAEIETETEFYYNASQLFSGRIDNKVESLKNLILEIDRLSWELFDENKISGANCIDIFSPKVARIFDMTNTLTDNIRFNNNGNYSNKNSYFIGELNGKYKVFMPKETTRIVLSEKISNNDIPSEKFITKKSNMIEIYNSEIPEKRFTINLNGVQ